MLKSASTHDVTNQAPPIAPYNVFEADLPLGEALEREGGGWGVDRLRDTGELAGSPEAIEHADRAERNEPILRTHDRYGNRIDEVELDPSWHWSLRQAIEREIHCLPWRDPQPGAHTVRAALFVVWSQVGSGVMCPVSMTYAAIPALRENPELAAEWEPRLTRAELRRRRPRRHGDDREAGRLGRARQHHPRRAAGRRDLRADRPQVVLLLSPVRRLPDARPGARRAVLLPVRGARPGLPHPAAQGQAGHALAAVERGRVPRRARPADRRGGPRRGDDHPHGQPHAAGLPARLDRLDALGSGAGRPPRPPPQRLRQAAGRAAGDAERARRPGRRVGGGDRHRDADRPLLRRGRRAVPPLRDRGLQVLGLQARGAARGRGARVPGRQRLRGGVGHAAPAARRAAQLDLGGLRQRGRARRPARDGQGAGGAAGVHGRVRARPRRQRAARRPPRSASRPPRRRRSPSSRRAGSSRTSRSRSRPACSCATHRPRWRTRSAPAGSARAVARSARCRRA